MRHLTLMLLLPLAIAATAQAQNKKNMNQKEETATFGAGCFWCTEAVFLDVKGVSKVGFRLRRGPGKKP